MIHTTHYAVEGSRTPCVDDVVCISYKGRLVADASVFDASDAFEFTLGAASVINGWNKGIAEMRDGEEARLIVHHSLAYGEAGEPDRLKIPPFANLDFNMKLLWVEKPDTSLAVSGVTSMEKENILRIVFVSDESGESKSIADQNAQTSSHVKGDKWLALVRSAKGQSISEWLLSMEEGGKLLQYYAALKRDFDSADQIVSVYAKENQNDGSTTLELAFFDDFQVDKLGHRRLFERWFEGML